LLVSNKTAFDWTGEFSVYQGHEQTWAGRWWVNGREYTDSDYFAVTVPSYGTAKLVLTGDAAVRVGYMEMYGSGYSSSYDVSIAYFYQYFQGGKLTTSTGSRDADWSKIFYAPVEAAPSVNTGIAWSPSGFLTPESFEMLFTLYIPDETGYGQVHSSKRIDFTGHGALFINEIFPELAGTTFKGYLKIETPEYICLEVLRMDSVEGGILLTATPPDHYAPE
jgi:hypothetical protein